MSRLYGRTDDVYYISKFLMENNHGKYKRDLSKTSPDGLVEAAKMVDPYFSKDMQDYLNECHIRLGYNNFIRNTIYSGTDDKENIIIFPTKKPKEEYKRELLYFVGDLLRRKNMDLVPSEFDLKCQYSDLLPLLVEYLYMKEDNKEDSFSSKHISDLTLNAKEYIKIFEDFNSDFRTIPEGSFLWNTLLFLVPLSSLEALLQIIELGYDKEEIKKLIEELYENKNNNREEIMLERNIDSYGFKALRKEIKRRG